MKKQKIQFLALCVVLVAVVIFYFALTGYNEQKEDEEREATEAEEIVAFEADEVTAFSYTLQDETLSFSKKDEKWQMDSAPEVNLDESEIKTILNALEKVIASEKITSEEYGDSSEYGFDTPYNIITVTTDEVEKTLTIGNYNEMMSLYYLKVEGDENLYLVDDTFAQTFTKSLEDLTAEEEETETQMPSES